LTGFPLRGSNCFFFHPPNFFPPCVSGSCMFFPPHFFKRVFKQLPVWHFDSFTFCGKPAHKTTETKKNQVVGPKGCCGNPHPLRPHQNTTTHPKDPALHTVPPRTQNKAPPLATTPRPPRRQTPTWLALPHPTTQHTPPHFAPPPPFTPSAQKKTPPQNTTPKSVTNSRDLIGPTGAPKRFTFSPPTGSFWACQKPKPTPPPPPPPNPSGQLPKLLPSPLFFGGGGPPFFFQGEGANGSVGGWWYCPFLFKNFWASRVKTPFFPFFLVFSHFSRVPLKTFPGDFLAQPLPFGGGPKSVTHGGESPQVTLSFCDSGGPSKPQKNTKRFHGSVWFLGASFGQPVGFGFPPTNFFFVW